MKWLANLSTGCAIFFYGFAFLAFLAAIAFVVVGVAMVVL